MVKLLDIFDRYLEALIAVTRPSKNGDRIIISSAGAVSLSEEAGRLASALRTAWSMLLNQEFGERPSDAGITILKMRFGNGGANANLTAALQQAMEAIASPVDRQHDQHHFRMGEAIDAERIESFRSAKRELVLAEKQGIDLSVNPQETMTILSDLWEPGTSKLAGQSNELTDRERGILLTLLDNKALNSESRWTTKQVAKYGEGNYTDPHNLKHAASALGKQKLVESQTGREGGLWLTEEGRELAQYIKDNS